MLRRIQIAVVMPQQTPTKRPPTLSKAKRTQRQNQIEIERPLPTLSKTKKKQRRNQIETGPPLHLRTSNSSKAFATVKNFAPDCCNNSTRFLRLGTPLAASS